MKLTGMKVLLAEDNPTNQMVAMRMLEALGAEVTLAEDGARALEIAERGVFDFMLVDIEMPRVSGIDVIRHVRASPPPGSETPIIALTAYVMREHREPIMAAGADGIIPKPIVSIEQLGRDILDLIAVRRARGAAPGNAVIAEDIYRRLAETIGAEAMSELLARVTEDLAAAGGQVERALPGPDRNSIRSGTHVIISVAGAIGATGLQHAAQALNAAAHGGDDAALTRDGPAMVGLLGEVRREIATRRQG